MTEMALRRAVTVREEADRDDRLPAAFGGTASRSPSASVLQGALAILGTQPITWAAGLLVVVAVPRYLTDYDVGRSVVASTISGLAGAVLSLGLTTSLTRRVATRPERAATDATAALALVLAVSVPAAVGLYFAGPLLGFPGDGDFILPIALATMVIAMAQSVLFSVLVGQQRNARYAWLNAAGVAIGAVAGVAILAIGGTLEAFMGAGAVAFGSVTIVGWGTAGLRFNREGLSLRYLVGMIRESLPFVGSGIANRLRGDIEVALLAAVVSQQVVGWWGAAVRIISFPIFVPVLMTTPLMPALTRCVDDRAAFLRTLRQNLILMLIFTVPTCALIMALAPAIPGLLGWKAGFENAADLIMVLSLQVPLVATGMVLGTGLIALGDERRWLGINILTTILSGGIMLLTIPAFSAWFQNGAIGAAIGRVLCEIVIVACAGCLSPRGTIDRAALWTGTRVVIASGGLAVVVTLLIPTSLILAVAAGGFTFITVGVALGLTRSEEIRTMSNELVESLMRRWIRRRT